MCRPNATASRGINKDVVDLFLKKHEIHSLVESLACGALFRL